MNSLIPYRLKLSDSFDYSFVLKFHWYNQQYYNPLIQVLQYWPDDINSFQSSNSQEYNNLDIFSLFFNFGIQ